MNALHIALVTNATLLTHVPMIMTHDSGSGYLGSGLVDRWTRTQPGGFAAQLGCGARSFDARPLYRSGRVIWHHGSIPVEHGFADTLDEMIGWLADNPEELAMLNVWDCEGDGCMDAVTSLVRTAKITTISDCATLKGLTLGAARALGALPDGGALLVITGTGSASGAACAKSHYDATLECYGESKQQLRQQALPRDGLVNGCWKTDADHQEHVDRMLTSLDDFLVSGLLNTSFMQAQALWQEGTKTVVEGTLRNSSLLRDESESGLNAILAAQVRAKRWPAVGLLEVNNVCDGGPDLLKALRETYFSAELYSTG
jgi:hypothetical protein